MNKRKLFRRVLAGSKNIRFADLVALAEAFGFETVRISGSHHIFEHLRIPELLNIQNRKGNAKPYQVRQFLTRSNGTNWKWRAGNEGLSHQCLF